MLPQGCTPHLAGPTIPQALPMCARPSAVPPLRYLVKMSVVQCCGHGRFVGPRGELYSSHVLPRPEHATAQDQGTSAVIPESCGYHVVRTMASVVPEDLLQRSATRVLVGGARQGYIQP